MAERGNGGIIGPANVPTNQVATGVWNLEEQQIAKSLGAWPSDYQISRSLRFNSADSAYLNRTPASAGNRRTWTWSAWVKLGQLNLNQYGLFSARSGVDSTRFTSGLFNSNTFLVSDISSSNVTLMSFETTQVFRDPSAWYHFLIAVDTTQATNTNRFKLYVNGVQVTSFSSATYPSQNADTGINATIEHNIGKYALTGNVVDGYMTEVNFIDGQALTPSSFGITNPDTGVWQPKPYAGTYGTNGFYLNFSDNSNTTATTLGKDYSGNGNNWTPNNFSVTAGAGNDSLADVPTPWGTDTGVGGTVRGNYCTLNPLFNATTLSNGNLDASLTSASITGTFGPSSGKWYFECTANTVSATEYLGIADQTLVKSDGSFSYSQVYVYLSTGFKGGNGSSASYGATWTSGDVIGVAYDLDVGSITFYKNGVSQGIAFNTGFTAGNFWRPFLYGGTSTNTFTFNFGQRPFAYTAPSGFKALCTQNLPTPTVGATASTQAGKYFNAVTYTAPVNSGTLTVTGVGFQPDFTWWKTRSTTDSNILMNVLSGSNKYLLSNSTDAEATYSGIWTATSDGFTASAFSYSSNQTYVAWNWKANGAGVTNTAGSITSTVSANTTSGFSVVTFTGNGTAGATVGHGLGVAPSMVIVKSRGNARDWLVYHKSIGATQFLQLNTTIAATAATSAWNDTAPTSTVFSLGTSLAGNESGVTRVAYCFAEVPGFSKFGSYVGNGSSDGPFVYCGFRPKYVLVKCYSNSGLAWPLYDGVRGPYNQVVQELFVNLANGEQNYAGLDLLSNGFKLRSGDADLNNSGYSFIFMAFAEFPQKFALAR